MLDSPTLFLVEDFTQNRNEVKEHSFHVVETKQVILLTNEGGGC